MSESNATELIKYLTEDNLKLMYGRLNRRYAVVDVLPSVDSLEPADKNVIYVVKETVGKAVRYWPNVLDNDAWKPFGIDREDLDRKADKVSNATDGNFAGLDDNGNLTDSGYKASDFKPKINEMIGATASTAGTAGLVPAPAAGDQGKVLTGDGTWSEVEEYTDEYIDSLFAGNVVVIGGRNYPYVQIGNQLWLAENLDYKFEVNGSQLPIGVSKTPSTPSAWYYNNDEKTYGVNGNKYGLLYNWYAAKYLEDNKSTLLPEGWHIPTTEEWDTLMSAVGGYSIAGTKLKSITGWDSGNGDDSYGFNAFPSGGGYDGSFGYLGSRASFWTSIERNSRDAYSRALDTGTPLYSGSYSKISGYSVRLVKNS